MDVTIGIAENGRQLTLAVDDKPEAIEKQVTAALAGTVLSLVDEKGRRVVVPSAKIAFVEIGPVDGRRVGFVGGS